ncbi:hypothetical protein NUW54_g13222 [Trametes sanguinea]|uniref:Uncharacterized protein n=1 Tax=Trametes sanguinea TaxID=158606 RepID=A0ACC1MNN7_9APHY|nr:hypothetical protein NUW54_g13222 [Trametes sanguinea]
MINSSSGLSSISVIHTQASKYPCDGSTPLPERKRLGVVGLGLATGSPRSKLESTLVPSMDRRRALAAPTCSRLLEDGNDENEEVEVTGAYTSSSGVVGAELQVPELNGEETGE